MFVPDYCVKSFMNISGCIKTNQIPMDYGFTMSWNNIIVQWTNNWYVLQIIRFTFDHFPIFRIQFFTHPTSSPIPQTFTT